MALLPDGGAHVPEIVGGKGGGGRGKRERGGWGGRKKRSGEAREADCWYAREDEVRKREAHE